MVKMAKVLDKGTCSWGYADEKFEPENDLPMAGHAMTGSIGSSMDSANPLHMRTLLLNPGDPGSEVVICFMDLLSGSVALLNKVRATMTNSHSRIALVGTHTHYAPGRYFGNTFYDTFAQPHPPGSAPLGQASQTLLKLYADTIVSTIDKARTATRSGQVAVIESQHWLSGANRSYDAFKSNGDLFDEWNDDGQPAEKPNANWHDWQKAIDPRITTILAVDEGNKHVCAFSTVACHTTCMGPYQKKYSADWPGFAVQEFANAAPSNSGFTYSSAFAMSAGGDVSTMAIDKLVDGGGEDAGQGQALARRRGVDIGKFVGGAVNSKRSEVASANAPINVSFKTMEWDPQGREADGGHELGPPYPGWPLVVGNEDGHGKRISNRPHLKEGYSALTMNPPQLIPAISDNQHPKLVVFEGVLTLLKLTTGVLNVADKHPICQLEIGQHTFISAPSELTTMAGFVLEALLKKNPGLNSTSVLTNTNDYMGYVTTPSEYIEQHYEGGHTLFGKRSLAALVKAHRDLAAAQSASPRGFTEMAGLDSATTDLSLNDQDFAARSEKIEAERHALLQELRSEEAIIHVGSVQSIQATELAAPVAESATSSEITEITNDLLSKGTRARMVRDRAPMEAAAAIPEPSFEVNVAFLTDGNYTENKIVYLRNKTNGEIHESRLVANFGNIAVEDKDLRAAVFVVPGDPTSKEELEFLLELQP